MVLYEVEKVYVTEGFPAETFIDPEDFGLITLDLRNRKKPVVFEGASGTGKTTTIIRGFERVGITSFKLYSPRLPKEYDEIRQILKSGRLPVEFTIIDDVHRLTVDERRSLSDLLRANCDKPEELGGKLVVAGINKAGEQLISASQDLLKRMAIHRVSPAERGRAIERMKHGADLLNITLENVEEIVDEAKGDYWTIQRMCQLTCAENKVYRTEENHKKINTPIADLRRSLLRQLSAEYESLVIEFVQGLRFRKTNRPYLILLELFAREGHASCKISELIQKYPEQRIRLESIKKTRLPDLLNRRPNIREKFYYDAATTVFSVEDPALSYYLSNMSWNELASKAGFAGPQLDFDYEFGISFAGEVRDLAKKLADCLEADDVTVFYDEHADLLGKNLEDQLSKVYGSQSKYVIVLVSQSYKERVWTSFESAVWTSRSRDDCIIPIFVDDIILKEISTSTARIDFQAYRRFKSSQITSEEYNNHFNIALGRLINLLENR